jgi:molecular chaperone GrpE (heat shock protein)
MTEREHWHLSKSVPVSALLSFWSCSLAALSPLSQRLKSDVTRAQADIERLDRQVEIMRTSSQEQAQRLARIEERLLGVQGSLDRLVQAIESRN